MENLEGVMLISFFNSCPRLRYNDNDLRFIYLQIADAINKLHTAGIAHRDIKPENIMIMQDLTIKLIDLGYGLPLKGKKDDGFNRTDLGTRNYKAPEISAGKPYQG